MESFTSTISLSLAVISAQTSSIKKNLMHDPCLRKNQHPIVTTTLSHWGVIGDFYTAQVMPYRLDSFSIAVTKKMNRRVVLHIHEGLHACDDRF